jgi:hypothetical protein
VRLLKLTDLWLNMERLVYCHDYPELRPHPTLYVVFAGRNVGEPPVQLPLAGEERRTVLAWLDRHSGGR